MAEHLTDWMTTLRGDHTASCRPPEQSSVSTVIRAATACLSAAGIESARLDAQLMLSRATGLSRDQLLTRSQDVVSSKSLSSFGQLLARRLNREPISRIFGQREFWSLEFIITGDTLDPRPDSETLVEAALKVTRDSWPDSRERALAILDLGTGSGCLLLALLSELPAANGLGIDINPGAVAAAAMNAGRLEIERPGLAGRARFQQADWGGGLVGRLQPSCFELVVANPPYIAEAAMADLQPEVVCFDPRLALVAGEDGLAAYRLLAPQLPGLLTPDGFAVLEVGAGQAKAVAAMVEGAGLDVIGCPHDLAGHERCVVARRIAEIRKPSDGMTEKIGLG